MSEVLESAFAKLNLSLDIVGRLPDGYHEMKMVMQSVALCDDVRIRLREDDSVTAKCDLRYLPCDDRNLAVRAARSFLKAAGLVGTGVDIELKKRIPVCAGLGGGSSDAAAVLRGLNRLTGAGMDEKQLCEIGFTLGSDVPFCIAGGTVLARGKGEKLTELPPVPECHIVICKPGFSISTPELFSQIRCERIRCRPDTDGLIGSIGAGDVRGIARRLYNVFEDVLPKKYAGISDVRSRLMDCGALGVAMSGTGSAVFGIYESSDRAAAAYEILRSEYRDCFLTKTVKKLDIV